MKLKLSCCGILFYLCLKASAAAITKSETDINFGYDLVFSSVDDLTNDTRLYQIKVKVSDGFDKTCKFRGIGIASQNVTVTGDMVFGSMTSKGQVKPTFSCKSQGKHLTATFTFKSLKFSTNERTIFRIYDVKDCRMVPPKHYTTEFLRIMNIELTCRNDNLQSNNLKFRADGFVFNNGTLSSLPYNFFDTTSKVKDNKNIGLILTSIRDASAPVNVLLDFTIKLVEEDGRSPIESSRYKYYYPKSLGGHFPAIDRGVIGILGKTFTHYYLSKDDEAYVSCFMGGNPEPKIIIFKDGIPLQGTEERSVGLYGPYMKISGYQLPFINESTMGNYTCAGESNGKFLYSTTIFEICNEPDVKFSIAENETEIRAVIQTEYTSPIACFMTDETYNRVPVLTMTDSNGNEVTLFNRYGNYRNGRTEITWKDEAKSTVPDIIICSIENVCTERKMMAFPMTRRTTKTGSFV